MFTFGQLLLFVILMLKHEYEAQELWDDDIEFIGMSELSAADAQELFETLAFLRAHAEEQNDF
jgi:hypothetical protein